MIRSPGLGQESVWGRGSMWVRRDLPTLHPNSPRPPGPLQVILDGLCDHRYTGTI